MDMAITIWHSLARNPWKMMVVAGMNDIWKLFQCLDIPVFETDIYIYNYSQSFDNSFHYMMFLYTEQVPPF